MRFIIQFQKAITTAFKRVNGSLVFQGPFTHPEGPQAVTLSSKGCFAFAGRIMVPTLQVSGDALQELWQHAAAQGALDWEKGMVWPSPPCEDEAPNRW